MDDTLSITLATLQTPNFEFVAAGTDPEHALRVLEAAWSQHAKQYARVGGTLATFEQITGAVYGDGPENVRFTTLPVGGATRDGERIV